MELTIKPHNKNSFPLSAILIKGDSAALWLKEIQLLQLSLPAIRIYPLPGVKANSIWGCLVITPHAPDPQRVGKNELCQMVTPALFIPERSMLYPAITIPEIEKIFTSAIHILHPEFGLVELTEELNLAALLQNPPERSYYVTRPKTASFVPKEVKSFRIQPVSPEETLKNMEENLFPKKEVMEDKPLSAFEKIKLGFYKMLFKKGDKENEKGNAPAAPALGDMNTAPTGKTGLLAKFAAMLAGAADKVTSNMQQDKEALEKRNQKKIDKLLELLKNNPEEALKYAIPLDDKGSSRGINNGELDLSKRWGDFSLLGNRSGGGGSGGSVDIGNYYQELQKQYNATAEELIRQKEYHKAAFVYLKLLKNNSLAAQTLEDGGLYQEAATIYLKHLNNKERAAACYEKGNMTSEAIELYKELNENEKVGDLYTGMHKKKEANVYFEKVVEDHKAKNRYVKASQIYKLKMNDEARGQSVLLEGWRENKDAYNCLHTYFERFEDPKVLKTEIDTLYKHDLTDQNAEIFLHVIRHEYNKHKELSEPLREMAYEIIAKQLPVNKDIVSELKSFNPKDKQITKDTMRFKIDRKM